MGPLTYLHSGLLMIRIVWILPYCIGDILLRNKWHSTTNRGWNLIFFTELSLLELLGILENSVTEYSFPGIKNPGKFCPVKSLSWNFLKIFSLKVGIPGIYSHRIFHSWNLFWSWNFLFLESYFTEFSCYRQNLCWLSLAFIIDWRVVTTILSRSIKPGKWSYVAD